MGEGESQARWHPLWWIDALDNIDKHGRVALTAAALQDPAVGVPAGVDPDVRFHHAGGPVQGGQVLMSFLGRTAGVFPMFERNVALAEPLADVALMEPVIDSLTVMRDHAAATVARVRASPGGAFALRDPAGLADRRPSDVGATRGPRHTNEGFGPLGRGLAPSHVVGSPSQTA